MHPNPRQRAYVTTCSSGRALNRLQCWRYAIEPWEATSFRKRRNHRPRSANHETSHKGQPLAQPECGVTLGS